MKYLLNYKSLIRIAVIMVVMAFMASQVTDTYARENQGNPQIIDNLQQHDIEVKAEIATHDGNMTTEHNVIDAILDALLAASGNRGATASVQQLGTVKCGDTVTIFQHYTNFKTAIQTSVMVTVSDFCSGRDSKLSGLTSSQHSPIDIKVPDGNTITASFGITNALFGGKIELECLGDSGEGFCIYKIEDIRY